MAGFRTFATGEVLTAANVNNFLMKQSVMVFADAAARTAALGSEVAEGMLTYNEDAAQLEVFDGTNFVVAAPEPPAGIGSNVVQTVKTNTFSTTSATYQNVTGMAATITPTAATSKVLVIVQATLGATAGTFEGPFIRITGGDATDYVGDASGSRTRTIANWVSVAGFSANYFMPPFTAVYLDAPGVATATTYQLQLRRGGGGTAHLNRSGNDDDVDGRGGRGASSITVIEVAA